MTTEKTYEFYGIDAKTEIRIGIITGICMLVIWALTFFLLCSIMRINLADAPPPRLFFGCMMLGLGSGLFVMKFMGKKYRKLWTLKKQGDELIIKYGDLDYQIFLKDVFQVRIYGSSEFRYFTIKDKTKSIKIRVGNSSLTPFSRQGDVKILDSFIEKLKPYLDRNFIKKDKVLSISPRGTVKLTYKR